MPLGFLGTAIARPDLLGTGNLGKPVGHGRWDYRTEINLLRFLFRHYKKFRLILGRYTIISVDPVKQALKQRIGETIVCLMRDSNINT
jgi:hypothetical protein